ncbi:nucleoside triphosphate pyrophosphohydrolase [Tersicoccus solisilvae]|uniref:Nucleoside triphosphate pyrophosphohydrolase n=1 Tax=Tersicoccus solisilvae TaxID=1882339 RepID=A0ABQ1P9H9_9MICC|nr:MazG family protein [Tersicoccus solisilvae]GGC92974.1 nucleoside triphosphate pyrophosphohydrolase [Tersicoccus solisilvae]
MTASPADDAPGPAAPDAGEAFAELVAVMDRLRSPGGCPWDAAQTHASLLPYLIEEAHELVEAVETGGPDDVREELGDVLLQVVFHARVAQEAGAGAAFDVADVIGTLVEKLRRRHPHVFAVDPAATDEVAPGLADLHRRWDEIKRVEKPERTGPFDGIPPGLPALALAQKTLGRAQRAGWEPAADPAGAADLTEADLGDALLALVRRGQAAGLDAEAALRHAVRRYRADAGPDTTGSAPASSAAGDAAGTGPAH